ncbi:MAG: PD40 domain-containing protein [Candidatus Riflebacteria bacterium]|nr:PD40 domain-containing protein [Candidatus Riflebacteria bacterium]
MRKTEKFWGILILILGLLSLPVFAEKAIDKSGDKSSEKSIDGSEKSSDKADSSGKILFVDTSEQGKTYLATINPDGTGKVRLTPAYNNIVFPRWAEKTGWIGFTNKLPDMRSEVFLLNRSGNKIIKFREGVSLEGFSPDGKFLLYSTCDQNPTLYAYSIKSKISTKLSTDQKITSADWSPKSDWIVASALMEDGTSDLFLISTLAQGIVRLTTTPKINESFPVFARDGKHIAYICDRNGRSEIEFLNIDTKEFQRPILVGLYPSISPDDKHVVFEAGTDIVVSQTNGLEQKAICKGRTPFWIK